MCGSSLTVCLRCREVPLVRDAESSACQVDDDCSQGLFTELAAGLHVVSAISLPLSVCPSVSLSVCQSACAVSGSVAPHHISADFWGTVGATSPRELDYVGAVQPEEVAQL